MLSLAARLLGSFVTPLTDKLAEASARLLRKLALFAVAAVCMVVVLIALTVAFDLWVASKAGPIAGALSVAGVYCLVAIVAVVFALRNPNRGAAENEAPRARESAEQKAAEAGLNAHIDGFVAPLVGVLQQLGLRRERLAVLAGATVAKRLGPVPLVGLAIVGGFLLGRMWKNWRELLSTDLLAMVLGLVGLAGAEAPSEEHEDPGEAPAE